MNIAPKLPFRSEHLRTDSSGVVQCYDILSLAERIGGVSDFTDGIYHAGYGEDRHGYEMAQAAQARYLLNWVGAEEGDRILDIGCGYGRILKTATGRGCKAVGITLSEPQAARCKEQGLDVHVMNYRDIPPSWSGSFTGIVANGSLEHFAQPVDAWRGLHAEIWHEFFRICWHLLPLGGNLATTAIHFRDPKDADPLIIMRRKHARRSRNYQFRSLFSNLHGWYPIPGELERAAQPYFKLIHTSDGTDDYRRTSEYWLSQIKRKFTTSPRAIATLTKSWLRRDPTWGMIKCWAFDQSWAWQFRPGPNGEPPPTILYRHVWKRTP